MAAAASDHTGSRKRGRFEDGRDPIPNPCGEAVEVSGGGLRGHLLEGPVDRAQDVEPLVQGAQVARCWRTLAAAVTVSSPSR